MGCADSATVPVDGRRGSNVHEVNQWLWLPHLGGLSVEKTEERKQAASDRDERHQRGVETRRRRKEDQT
jgi:hypothetical protein